MSSDDPTSPQAPIVPEVVPARPRPSRWLGWLFLLLVLGGVGVGGVMLGMAAATLSVDVDSPLEERYHSLSRYATQKVAVLRLEGTIIDGDGFIKKQIDRIRDDEHVKAVVLRVNSPGGTVTGSDYIYHHLRKLCEERKLPLVVSMGSLAASGGYYVSMAVGQAENVIFAEPTTWTGSIGVVIPHYDISRLAEIVGVSEDSIKSHRLKQMGSPFKEMTDEERQIFQQLVDETFDSFKTIVKQGRPKLDEAALTKVATGQIFTTRQALAHGLVDRQGFLEDAIDRAIELAALDQERTKVVEFRQPLGLFGTLLESRAAARPTVDLATLVQWSTPRAWYLFTWRMTP